MRPLYLNGINACPPAVHIIDGDHPTHFSCTRISQATLNTPLPSLILLLQASLRPWHRSARLCRPLYTADSRQRDFAGVNTGLTSVNIVLQNMKIGGEKVHFLRKINFLSCVANFILPMNNRQEIYVNMLRDTATFGASKAETLNSDPFFEELLRVQG